VLVTLFESDTVASMIRVSVLYSGGDGVTFDHDYCKNTHVPMACAAWVANFTNAAVVTQIAEVV
jgi:hypothetical protein